MRGGFFRCGAITLPGGTDHGAGATPRFFDQSPSQSNGFFAFTRARGSGGIPP
jgi:hypothetical protein